MGNNPSLEDVRQDLNLLTYLDSYGIRLRWESDEPELWIPSVNCIAGAETEGIGEQGIKISLHVRMTEGNWRREYELSVCVKPPVLTQTGTDGGSICGISLRARMNCSPYTAYMKLPEEYQVRA